MDSRSGGHKIFTDNSKGAPFRPNLGPFWPWNAQKRRLFAFFSNTAHWNFLIFCTKPSLWRRKKMPVSISYRKFENDPFRPKSTQICPEVRHVGRQKLPKKNFSFLFVQKSPINYFAPKKSIFTVYPLYVLRLPTLCEFLKCVKQRFFTSSSKSAHWYFLLFCTKPSLWSRKKWQFCFFVESRKNIHISAQLDPNLTQIMAFRS